MIIPNPSQIKEFQELPSFMDNQCEICNITANYMVLTKGDDWINVCSRCFELMMSVEALLRYSN